MRLSTLSRTSTTVSSARWCSPTSALLSPIGRSRACSSVQVLVGQFVALSCLPVFRRQVFLLHLRLRWLRLLLTLLCPDLLRPFTPLPLQFQFLHLRSAPLLTAPLPSPALLLCPLTAPLSRRYSNLHLLRLRLLLLSIVVLFL